MTATCEPSGKLSVTFYSDATCVNEIADLDMKLAEAMLAEFGKGSTKLAAAVRITVGVGAGLHAGVSQEQCVDLVEYDVDEALMLEYITEDPDGKFGVRASPSDPPDSVKAQQVLLSEVGKQRDNSQYFTAVFEGCVASTDSSETGVPILATVIQPRYIAFGVVLYLTAYRIPAATEGFCTDGNSDVNFDTCIFTSASLENAVESTTAALPSCTQVTVTVQTQEYADEVTWHVDDGQAFGPYESNGVYTETLCLDPGEHYLHYLDEYGDGWHGGTIEVAGYVHAVEVEGAGGVSAFTVDVRSQRTLEVPARARWLVRPGPEVDLPEGGTPAWVVDGNPALCGPHVYLSSSLGMWTNDGECDVPDYCPPGTDVTDCSGVGAMDVLVSGTSDLTTTQQVQGSSLIHLWRVQSLLHRFNVGSASVFVLSNAAPRAITANRGHSVIANGAEDGGAVQGAAGTGLTLQTCVFAYHRASRNGGAVFGGIGAHITVATSAFVRNEATGGHGGAIYGAPESRIVVDSSAFVQNAARGSATESHGGAIFGSYGSEIVVRTSTFGGNRAEDDGGAVFGSPAPDALGNYCNQRCEAIGSTIVVSDVAFIGNIAGGMGGAISTSFAPIAAHSSTFDGNQAKGGFTGFGKGDHLFLDPTSIVIRETSFNPFDPVGGQSVYVAGALGSCDEHPCALGCAADRLPHEFARLHEHSAAVVVLRV